MPDKPKRRKNNKNKRKNKNNNYQNSSKNKSELNVGDITAESTLSSINDEVDSSISEPKTNEVISSDNTLNNCLNCNDSDKININIDKVDSEIPTVSAQTALNNIDSEIPTDSTDTGLSSKSNSSTQGFQDLLSSSDDTSSNSINYVVESPELDLKPILRNEIKSKSLDDDNAPKIIEIDDCNTQSEDHNIRPIIDSSSVIVSDVESDVEWETTSIINDKDKPEPKEMASGKLSVTSIPLTSLVQCNQTKSLTPEQELSLREYLDTLNLATHPPSAIEIKEEIEELINREVRYRLRKKGFTEELPTPRIGPARHLDVIDEESESSIASRRQSYLSEKKSDNDDLEDDVFVEKKTKRKEESMPQLSKLTKPINNSTGRQIPQQCVLVGTKIKEPEMSEARGNWSMKTVEKMTGAEIVYLTDSSSSTSSVYDLGEETDGGIETDVSVRMITPTIEVTDTEKLLKETFLQKNDKTLNLSPNSSKDVKDTEYENSNLDSHEIVILSTDDIKTSLYVKGLNEECIIKNSDNKTIVQDKNNDFLPQKNELNVSETDQEMKVLKCELNNAMNNLIKEVASDSESINEIETIARQDSSSSIDSSQCTAKYNPNSESLNDISNIMHDECYDSNKISTVHTHDNRVSNHVKDVFECVTGTPLQLNNRIKTIANEPLTLRDICVKRISSFPYGVKILEELASVSQRLQNYGILGSDSSDFKDEEEICFDSAFSAKQENHNKMPYYPLPDISSIEKVSLPTKPKNSIPPPVQPRKSSLKKNQDEFHWTGLPTQQEPVYVCLSPSQKMLMEKTNTVITKEDATQLVDMHKKYVDRRGYNEYYDDKAKQFDKERLESAPAIPFKSQTGSRLLAIIRDPAVTNNINSSSNRHHNTSLNRFQNNNSHAESHTKTYDQFRSSKELSNSFKPIPPPRPKKISSSVYESDESSDFTDNSLRSVKSERKFFHYSTGTLNKEIENDISSIQDMHRRYTNIRDITSKQNTPRRPSLPKDLCEQQMEYIRQKEKEVEAEIRRLEELKHQISDASKNNTKQSIIETAHETVNEQRFDANNFSISRKRDVAFSRAKSPENGARSKVSSLFSSSQEEILRDKMYSEYMSQMAERQERKQQKIIKITTKPDVKEERSKSNTSISKSMSALDILESKTNNPMEKEFIWKARERWNKLGIKDPETEDEREDNKNVYTEPKVVEHRIKVIEGGEEKDVQRLPNHLQEFVRLTAKDKKGTDSPAVWRPGAPSPAPAPAAPATAPRASAAPPPPPPPPVWTPVASPQSQRKNFRPVHFEDTPPARRKFENSEQNGCTSGSEGEGRLRTSQSAPAAGLNSLGALSPASAAGRLPRAQNPTVTLLQKAREGQLPRGSSYLQQQERTLPRDRASPPRSDPVHALRREYASEGEAERSEYASGPRKMATARPKIDGVGPTTKDGMPVTLRSEVKDPSKWYKKMYDTIHKNKYDDDYVTIRYKSRRLLDEPTRVTNKSQYAYFDPRSGYLSEPEGYASDVTSPRRRTASVQEDRTNDNVHSPYLPNNKFSTLASARARQEVYKNQPGRIENYVPGKSSVVEKETKQWWDEVMDIFDGWLDENSPLPSYSTLLARAIQKNQLSSTTSLPQASPKEKKDITSAILSKSNMARALKESGYESDSTLVFRRREEVDGPLSPAERRAAYRDLQAGGEPPLRGFRSPAPPRQEDDAEIEYIPISPTLTKIRVHKKTPKIHEVICYPVTNIESDPRTKFKKQTPSFISVDVPSIEYPPAPPRRVSSRNNRTLKLVDSTRKTSVSPKRNTTIKAQTNVDYLRNKISNKLTRQNTHIISKKDSILSNKVYTDKSCKSRTMSTSAPPAINRKSVSLTSPKNAVKANPDLKQIGTSSFGSPRRTLLPTEYSNSVHTRYYTSPPSSIAIEGGAGRRTPISNILDRVTSLDKLWSAEKRNEPIDKTKAKASLSKTNIKMNATKVVPKITVKSSSPILSPRGRDMVRTAEKVQKLKTQHAKSTPCLTSKNYGKMTLKPNTTTSNISKTVSNVPITTKKPNQIKTAVVTNLKNKKSFENVSRPRSSPCHVACSKKSKESCKDKMQKINTTKKSKCSIESECASQFGDISYETSNFDCSDDYIDKTLLTAKEIKYTRDAVISDSFFQNLFLRNSNLPIMTYPVLESNTNVLQKARLFQSYPQDYIVPKSINSYLIHRKPVSLSRFKISDRYSSHLRSHSPRSISWPGRMYGGVRKFDSLSKCDEFGSTSSLATVRSRSEPPDNKMYFSETSRPKSPTVVFCRKEKSPNRKSVSPTKLFFSQTSRPVSPKINQNTLQPPTYYRNESLSPTRIVFSETVRPISPTLKKKTITSLEHKSRDIEDKIHSTMYFSQTSRPVSPKVIKKGAAGSLSRSQSTSPVSIRSPSYRRIHSAKLQSTKINNDNVCKRVLRTRSADENKNKITNINFSSKTKSDTNLYKEDPDYGEYIRDMENTKVRTERFRELNRYYTYLERVGELEKATSTSDLRHRRKDEEIIDFDRWKKIRAIERAEEELNNLYFKLKVAQSENDVLFYPRDIKDFRWNFDKDRGLRIKEKSVEDLKEHFQGASYYETLIDADQPVPKDTYKPLWRGTSVAETAFNINRKNNKSDQKEIHFSAVKPNITIQQDSSLCELRKKIGLGNRLWSSLSMEQVHALKNQLNAIYSKELESKGNKDHDKFSVDVDDCNSTSKHQLHVRSNSLITSSLQSLPIAEMSKSESIAAITCPLTSVKELKNNVNKIQMSLTENEKRKISQTISKEVLDRIKKFNDSPPPLPLKQELENCEKTEKYSNELKEYSPTAYKVLTNETHTSDTECLEENKKNDKLEKIETIHQSSASETETASSDASNKTVIYKGSSKAVQEKVEYFESVKKMSKQQKVIYHAREDSDEKNKETNDQSTLSVQPVGVTMSPKSQSCANLKELFGESEKNKFLSLPPKPGGISRSTSPRSEIYINDRRTPDTLRYSSDETIWRSRSPSPEPERYWRAYLKLARVGEVRRLARRFDSPTPTASRLRRYRSDPELTRNAITDWHSNEGLNSRSRETQKNALPVVRVPLRPGNRFMPHIDIISKLAALRRRTAPRSRSAEEALECRAGEVEKIRRRFEVMSLLGQIYSSAPDVSELQDIAHYLSGPWLAHRYPKQSDNNKSIEDPTKLVRGRLSPVRKTVKTVSPKEPVKLSSILKNDVFGKQVFDPSLHRPASRYEPPRAPPRPPPASWPYRLAPYVMPSRHTVTFKEGVSTPEPPRRAPYGSHSDTESPRRYVESDVNIHYRCPVRRDPLPLVPERELARQQAEHMKRLYREQKRTKYLQELQDMQSRRHQDNFTPSQKNILPLNRYDEAEKVVARALYVFNGQTAKELSFRKGDIIHVRRQIDNNWYEGELHGRVGLFPYNYVEILKGDVAHSPKKTSVIEGRARAKFDFTAQTNLELPLKKGEVVVLTRRIDQNWWEGRSGNKTGIFPDSYVQVLQEPSQNRPEVQSSTEKPLSSPAAHGLVAGSARRSMGAHSYTPVVNNPALSNAPPATHPLPGYVSKPAQGPQSASERGYGPPTAPGTDLNNREPLYVDTNAEAVPFRAMYKYRPQNPDELELAEGDTVYVLEKCDDGWYVGSSQRTGRFGTFPGNYVERI